MIAAATRLSTPTVEWLPIVPTILLMGAALLILMVKSVARQRLVVAWPSITIACAGVVGSAWALIIETRSLDRNAPAQSFGGMVVSDHFAVFASITILVGLAFALAFVPTVARQRSLPIDELLVLMLMAAAGMQVMVGAYDLIVVFLGLELFSIALYVLVGSDARRTNSLEGAFKYFVLGAFSSAIFLYGIAMVYASAGSTRLGAIATYFDSHTLTEPGTMLAGLVLLAVGFGFKAAAVPFHMWSPDAYEGAPTPITSFMASTVKAASFAAMIRVIDVAMGSHVKDWQPMLFALAAGSMVIGAVIGIVQRDVKRMLAYSSISHAGYMMVGIQAATAQGRSATLFYLLAYAIIVSGTFGVLQCLESDDDVTHPFSRYAGLSSRRPVLAGLLTVFLIAQAGIPFTAGFSAKLAVFQAGVNADQYGLVIVAVLAAAIAAFMYLRVIAAMYMSESDATPPEEAPARLGWAPRAALGLAVLGTFVLGVAPDWWLRWAGNAHACVTASAECLPSRADSATVQTQGMP